MDSEYLIKFKSSELFWQYNHLSFRPDSHNFTYHIIFPKLSFLSTVKSTHWEYPIKT